LLGEAVLTVRYEAGRRSKPATRNLPLPPNQEVHVWKLLRLSPRSLAVAAVVAFTLPLGLAAPAQAGDRTLADPSVDGGDLVVTHDSDAPLADATTTRLRGDATGDGGCVFTIPQLSLAPDQSIIEARQVATNFTDCTTTVEIGTPVTEDDRPEGGTFDSDPARSLGAARDGDAQINAVSSSGYYRVWWEDVINIRVHEVKTNISWTWDGICVTASSGSANYWWLSGTGWSKDSSSSTISRACSSARVFTDAVYKNGAFCWPGTVWSHYDNVTARGTSDGSLIGWVDSTWTTYPFACPTLHFHTQLVRVTG
jgi:hypothetical protein